MSWTTFVYFGVFCALSQLSTASVLKYEPQSNNERTLLSIMRKLSVISKPALRARALTLGSFSWKDCGTSSDLAKVSSISLSPDPLQIPGNVTVSFSGSMSKDIQAPLELNVDVKKKELFWIPIPCVDDIGSCDYSDICSHMATVACPPVLVKHGINCRCPIKAGQYSLPQSVISIGSFNIPSWLESGDYQVTGTAKQGSQQVLCLHLEFSLK